MSKAAITPDQPISSLFCEVNGSEGVTAVTWKEVARHMQVSETLAIQIAMGSLAERLGFINQDGPALPSDAQLAQFAETIKPQLAEGDVVRRESLLGVNWQEDLPTTS
jgi:hypothetical protein